MKRVLLSFLLYPVLALASPPTTVELIAEGSEPRQKLVVESRSETPTGVKIDLQQHVVERVAGKDASKTAMPRIVFEGTLQTIAADSDSFTYTMVFDAIRVFRTKGMEKGTDRSLRNHWKRLRGMKYHAKVSTGGILQSAKLTFPTQPHAALAAPIQSLQETLRSVQTPLPDVAIGVGAQWQVKENTIRDGVGMHRIRKWTLKKRGSTIRVTGKLVDTGDPAAIDIGDLPKDMRATVTAVGGMGSYVIGWTPKYPIASSWKLTMSHHLDLVAQIGTSRFTNRTEVTSKVHVRLTPLQ